MSNNTKVIEVDKPVPKAKPVQTCTTCAHIEKCWATHTNAGNPISTQNVIINILVCRLQLGIDRDAAAKNLINIFKPGMIKLLQYARQHNNINMDMDMLLTDMQSYAIQYLLCDYKIGDRGRATPYLFDPHQGFLTKWVMWVTGKQKKFYYHHELHAPSSGTDEEGVMTGEYEDSDTHSNVSWDDIYRASHQSLKQNEESSIMEDVMPIIEDGITLNSNEYRVIKYCLANGNEANASRHIDGLHISMAKLMGVSRPRITRLYKRAREKLLHAYKENINE